MANNVEIQKREWIQSAKLVERLNEERKKREKDQFKRQQRMKTYLDKQTLVET